MPTSIVIVDNASVNLHDIFRQNRARQRAVELKLHTKVLESSNKPRLQEPPVTPHENLLSV
jgi:hypothetical protein